MADDSGGTDEMDELESIEEQLAAAEQEEESSEGDAGGEHENESREDSAGDSTTETGAGTDGEETSSETAGDSGRPFSHEETDMVGMYVRGETERDWRDAKNAADAAVSKQLKDDDVASSEFHDAALRLVAAHPVELALLVLEERGVDADEERVQEIVELLQD